MSILVAPALLGADPLDLRSAIDRVERSNAPYLHLDVMDGHYTSDISLGLRTLAAIRTHTRMQLDVHLQTLHPERHVGDLIRIGVDRVSMHVDAAANITPVLDALQTAGLRKGIALNPEHGIEYLDPYLGRLDFIILMTSKPGTSTFDPTVPDKIRSLRAQLTENALDTVELIADGGITPNTAHQVIDAGIDTLVAASAIFGSPHETINGAISALTHAASPPAPNAGAHS